MTARLAIGRQRSVRNHVNQSVVGTTVAEGLKALRERAVSSGKKLSPPQPDNDDPSCQKQGRAERDG